MRTQRETRGRTTWREDPVGRHLHTRDRTVEKPALPTADLGLPASGALVYAALDRGALSFPRPPETPAHHFHPGGPQAPSSCHPFSNHPSPWGPLLSAALGALQVRTVAPQRAS